MHTYLFFDTMLRTLLKTTLNYNSKNVEIVPSVESSQLSICSTPLFKATCVAFVGELSSPGGKKMTKSICKTTINPLDY